MYYKLNFLRFSNKLSPKLSMDVSNNSSAYFSLNNKGALYMLPLKNENNAYCNQSAFVLPFNKKETLDNTAKHKITISISIRIEHIFIVWPKKKLHKQIKTTTTN